MIDRARHRQKRAALVVGALLGTAVLAGCGAGMVTQTSSQVSAVEGSSAEVGRIAIRNATIEFNGPVAGAAVHPAGGTAPLAMAIVNTGTEADRLVAASSPVASSVQISGTLQIPGGGSLTVEGAPAPVAAAPAEGAAPAGAGAANAAPAPGRAPAPAEGAAPASPAPAEAPAPTTARPGGQGGASGQASVVLTGLHEEVRSGSSYPVVLTFERAGDVRVELPVATPDTVRENAHS